MHYFSKYTGRFSDLVFQQKHSTYMKEMRARTSRKFYRRLLLLIILLHLLVAYSVFAQLVTNSNVNITITPGALITVNGGITNQTGTTITNNGMITLTGDWMHNGGNNCFLNSQGTVAMTGTVQLIGGSDITQFNNLTLQNANLKTLAQDANVGGAYVNPSGILNLNDAYLDLNAHKLTITNQNPSAISRTSGFIQSETDPSTGYSFVKWITGNAAAGSNYTFPFGNTTTMNYIPLDITVNTAGSGAGGGFFSVATYPTDPNPSPNNRPFPSGVNALLNTNGTENAALTVDRYWLLHAGNFDVTPVSDIRFRYRDVDWMTGTNTINEANLQAQQLVGNQWSFPMTGWDNPAGNMVTVSNMGNYDTIWTLADNTSPLPVSLLSFDAEAVKNEKVKCTWITATEVNNDHFEVLRSKDASTFETIGVLQGAGNSTSVLEYEFTDEDPYDGVSYYRLKQVDYDGRITLSEIKAVLIDKKGNSFIAYPNPADRQLNIVFAEKISDAQLQLINAVGKVTWQSTVNAESNHYQVDVSAMANGTYALRMVSEYETGQQLIIIAH